MPIAKDICTKAVAYAEEANEIFQNASMTAASAAASINQKVIEANHINSIAVWDFAQKILAINSMSEFMELSTSHARRQFEIWPDQG